jgi:hypothetical protein
MGMRRGVGQWLFDDFDRALICDDIHYVFHRIRLILMMYALLQDWPLLFVDLPYRPSHLQETPCHSTDLPVDVHGLFPCGPIT